MGWIMSTKICINFVSNVPFKCNIQLPTHHNKNGVVERKTRSLKEMATCMIEARDISPKIWDEDINCTSHIYNREIHK